MYTFVPLFTELFEQYELHYIFTGKFQTDNMEARFGIYRMLSGSNYLVSVIEVLVDFPYDKVEVIVNQEDLSPLLYTTGYVARKLIHKVHCQGVH